LKKTDYCQLPTHSFNLLSHYYIITLSDYCIIALSHYLIIFNPGDRPYLGTYYNTRNFFIDRRTSNLVKKLPYNTYAKGPVIHFFSILPDRQGLARSNNAG